jgi:hypothetical protein
MLPMAYAPLAGGEVPPRNFIPDLPQPQQRATWHLACVAAIAFWAAATADTRISAEFRETCRTNGELLRSLADRV